MSNPWQRSQAESVLLNLRTVNITTMFLKKKTKRKEKENSQWQHEPVPAGPVVLLLLYLLFLIHTFYLAALGLRGSMWIFTEEH